MRKDVENTVDSQGRPKEERELSKPVMEMWVMVVRLLLVRTGYDRPYSRTDNVRHGSALQVPKGNQPEDNSVTGENAIECVILPLHHYHHCPEQHSHK